MPWWLPLCVVVIVAFALAISRIYKIGQEAEEEDQFLD